MCKRKNQGIRRKSMCTWKFLEGIRNVKSITAETNCTERIKYNSRKVEVSIDAYY